MQDSVEFIATIPTILLCIEVDVACSYCEERINAARGMSVLLYCRTRRWERLRIVHRLLLVR